MNILIEPIYNGLIQTLLSFSIISGLIFFGKKINQFFFKDYDHVFFNLLISLIIFSQLIKIFSYLGLFKEVNLVLAYLFLLIGIYNFNKILNFSKIKNFYKSINTIELIIVFALLVFFIITISPPSMADALDYHYGVPLYLLKYNQIPDLNLWLFGALAGNGEIINSLAIFLGSDNFGSLIQFISLILFFIFLKTEINQKNKFSFLILFIICSPTLLQLISGPKFLLFPQILTASALYISVKLKKIKITDFIFIMILLMGATQFKLSFLLSGFLIGLFTLYKALKYNQLKIIFLCFILSAFFFLPTAIWNYSQVLNFNYLNLFSPVPIEMIDNLKTYRENNFIYPLNLIFPKSLGNVSTIIGFQFLLLFFTFKKTKEFKIIIFITLITICFHYFFGMSISRIYYEFILWCAISFVFIKDRNLDYNFYTKLMLPQLMLVICFSLYFALTSISGIISFVSRDKFMIKNSNHYEAIKWVNKNLPHEAKVISNIRSVALLDNEFVPTDWIDFNLSSDQLNGYFSLIKQKKINYIILMNNTPEDFIFIDCLGDKFAQSGEFTKGTRNPFNRNSKYSLSIYHFNHKKLLDCAKR